MARRTGGRLRAAKKRLKRRYAIERECRQLFGCEPTVPTGAVRSEVVVPDQQSCQVFPALVRRALREGWKVKDVNKEVAEMVNAAIDPATKPRERIRLVRVLLLADETQADRDRIADIERSLEENVRAAARAHRPTTGEPMPFFTDDRHLTTTTEVDLKATGQVAVDFLRCACRNTDAVREHALTGEWAIRESAIGDIAVLNAALGVIITLDWPEVVVPPGLDDWALRSWARNGTLLDLRVWARGGPLPDGPRQRGNILLRDEGVLTRSGKWVMPVPDLPWARTPAPVVDIVRWYRDLFGVSRPKYFEM